MSTNSNSKSKVSYKALGLALGLIFGGFIGMLIGNPIIFTGGGMVLGLAIGTALDNRSGIGSTIKKSAGKD